MTEKIQLLNFADILFAAAAAYILTFLVLNFKRFKKVFKKSEFLSMDHRQLDLNAVLNKCRAMFPIKTFSFHGKVFTSGMIVRIKTKKQKIFEGEIIGGNNVNMVCIMTKNHIIAHEISKIEEITLVDKKTS